METEPPCGSLLAGCLCHVIPRGAPLPRLLIHQNLRLRHPPPVTSPPRLQRLHQIRLASRTCQEMDADGGSCKTPSFWPSLLPKSQSALQLSRENWKINPEPARFDGCHLI